MNNGVATLTGFVLAAFVGYIGAWYLGMVEGNFALMLFLATLITGIYWVAEKLYFLPARRKALADAQAQSERRLAELKAQGIHQVDGGLSDEAQSKLLMQPWWLDWTAGLFPVIVVVFVLRSFLFEPFKIPSGSMIPTLMIGDLILVNKFHYGVPFARHQHQNCGQQRPAARRRDGVSLSTPTQPGLHQAGGGCAG
jgi:signal peptidase I